MRRNNSYYITLSLSLPGNDYNTIDLDSGPKVNHEDWLVHQNTSFPIPAPVMVVNGTLGLEDFRSYVRDELLHEIIPTDLLQDDLPGVDDGKEEINQVSRL